MGGKDKGVFPAHFIKDLYDRVTRLCVSFMVDPVQILRSSLARHVSLGEAPFKTSRNESLPTQSQDYMNII